MFFMTRPESDLANVWPGICADDLVKGAWEGQERPGHKYIKREKLADGSYRYWYPDEGEREDKETTGRKHEPEGYHAPLHRMSDDAAAGVLRQVGDKLVELQAQDEHAKDNTGFSRYDLGNWHKVSGDVPRMRAMLSRYKRQIADMLGLDAYYHLGLHDAAVESLQGSGNASLRTAARSNGDLEVSIQGYIGRGRDDPKWLRFMEIKREFNIRSRKVGAGWENYITHNDWANLDVDRLRAELGKIDVNLPELPDRPALAERPSASGQPSPIAAPAVASTAPKSADAAIDSIIDKRAHNTIAIKVLTQGERAGNLAIWSTYSDDFREIMSNKSVDPRAISGIVEVVKEIGWARVTDDPKLYEEIIEKLRTHMPKFTIVIDPNVAEWQAKHAAQKLERQKPIPEVQAKLNPDIKLFPFQNEAIRFFVENDGNGLLGDEMGLGKTVEALGYAAATNRRTLVACPKVVRKNWLLEATRFFPGHFYNVKELTTKDLKKNGMPDLSKVKLATINYEILDKFMPAIQAAGFDLLIVDESHRAKNPKAQLTRNIQKIGKAITHKILLSGTALKNKRVELLTQLNLVRPGFVSEEELTHGFIGALHHKLAKVYLARKKKDVITGMPDKLKQAVQLEVSGVKAIEEIGDGSDLEEMTRMKHELAKAKAPVTADFVTEILESSDSNVLVFTDSVPAAEAIKAKLGDVAVLHTGQQNDKEEDAARAHFDPLRRKEGDKVRVLVSTTAKGIGFNAQTADKVVFNDLPWTPGDKDQAEDRAHRIGTKNTVNVYDIHAAGSLFDEKTAQLLLKKAVLYRKVLDGVKMTPQEMEWANSRLTPSEVIDAMRGKQVGPTVAHDAPAVRSDNGTVVVAPVVPVTPVAPVPVVPKVETAKVEPAKVESPKNEFLKDIEKREAAKRAEDARQNEYRVAATTHTNAAAAPALGTVPAPLKALYAKLHKEENAEAEQGIATSVVLTNAEGQKLASWFSRQIRAHNSAVDAYGHDHYVHDSPAGALDLRWERARGGIEDKYEWRVSYSSGSTGVYDSLSPEALAWQETLLTRFRAGQPLPKMVLPAAVANPVVPASLPEEVPEDPDAMEYRLEAWHAAEDARKKETPRLVIPMEVAKPTVPLPPVTPQSHAHVGPGGASAVPVAPPAAIPAEKHPLAPVAKPQQLSLFKSFVLRLSTLLKAGGPYIGPRGGKWADPQHTISWEEPTAPTMTARPPSQSAGTKKPEQLSLFGATRKPVVTQPATSSTVAEGSAEAKPVVTAALPPKMEIRPATVSPVKVKASRKELAVDVGEHVTGTRWEKAQALTVTDLEHMNPEDQVRAVTKQNLLSTWEPQELLDRGVEPEAVLLRHAMERCIVAKPENNGRARTYYLEGMDFFAKSMEQCKTQQDVMDFVEDWHYLMQGKRRVKTLSEDEVGQAYDDYLVSQGKTLKMPYAERKKGLEEIERLSHLKYTKNLDFGSPERLQITKQIQDLKDDFTSRGGDEYRRMPLNQVLARALGIDEYLSVSHNNDDSVTVFARDPNLESKVNENNTYARMAAGFGKLFVHIVGASSPKYNGPKVFREAISAVERWGKDKLGQEERIKALHEQLGVKRTVSKARETPFKWERSVPGEIDRKGGKPVGDVTPQALAKDFGFHNVQFGHWVSERDADSHLKGAYGAFSDLADMLDVDVKRVSMNGRLSLGIGARGGGKFTAHYEPGKAIINITKIAGGGCLAHEWAHAMDNLLAVSHNPSSTVASRMVSDGATEGIPEKVREAYADVMAAIRSKNPEAQKKVIEADALIKQLNAERRRATPEENKQIVEARRANEGNKHSEFYQDAASFSKSEDNYWTRGHEMFARSFEAYIEDTLAEEGRKSSYLVAGTQGKYPTGRYWSQKDGTKRECQPYPQGEERLRINAAIRRLIQAMGEERSLEKALAWLERQPLPKFVIPGSLA